MAIQLDSGLRARSRVGLRMSDYPGLTAREARVSVVAAIGNRIPCVSGEYINNALIERIVPVWQESVSQMATDGIVWATANVQSDGTYPILKNQPVCLDPTTGKYVTGIDPDWQGDEYYLVGVAMQTFAGPGVKKIPIKLSPPASKAVPPDTFIGIAVPDDNGSLGNPEALPFPSFEDWCKGVYSYNYWRFQIRQPATLNPAITTMGLYSNSVTATPFPYTDSVLVNNIQGCYYIQEGQQALINKVGSNYYFNYCDNKVYSGTLLDDLPVGGGPAKVIIETTSILQYAWIYSDIGVSSWAIPAGAKVMFGITGPLDDPMHAGEGRLKFAVIAADMCAQYAYTPGGP